MPNKLQFSAIPTDGPPAELKMYYPKYVEEETKPEPESEAESEESVENDDSMIIYEYSPIRRSISLRFAGGGTVVFQGRRYSSPQTFRYAEVCAGYTHREYDPNWLLGCYMG